MAYQLYIIKQNDTLWDIAKTQLGSGEQWPRLWRYNNRKEVVKVTGRAIPNPDLIYPGQILLIPKLTNTPAVHDATPAPSPSLTHPTPTKPSSAKTTQLPATGKKPVMKIPSPLKVRLEKQLEDIHSPISLKYRLEDVRFPAIDTPEALIEIRLTGDILLTTQQGFTTLYVTSRKEIEGQVVTQANLAYSRLISDTRVIYDVEKKSVTLRNMLLSQSNLPGGVATGVGVQLDSQNPIPKLRFEIRVPKAEGKIGFFTYMAIDVKGVIEITPKLPPPLPPSAQPIRIPEPTINWDKIIGTGLMVTGAALVVGTIVEDFLTVGAGLADDPVTLAAGRWTFLRGVSMWSTAPVILPTAAPAAALKVTFGVSLMKGGREMLIPSH